MSAWTDWDPCSTTCGLGTKQRYRFIATDPEHDGAACPTNDDGSLDNTDTDICQEIECIDCWALTFYEGWEIRTTDRAGLWDTRLREVASLQDGKCQCAEYCFGLQQNVDYWVVRLNQATLDGKCFCYSGTTLKRVQEFAAGRIGGVGAFSRADALIAEITDRMDG